MSKTANDIREEAANLLTQATAMDGLRPHMVLHHHGHGVSGYLHWSEREPTEEEMAAILEEEFEPDLDERLESISVAGGYREFCGLGVLDSAREAFSHADAGFEE